MKNQQRGFILPLLIILITAVILGGVIYIYPQKNLVNQVKVLESQSQQDLQSNNSSDDSVFKLVFGNGSISIPRVKGFEIIGAQNNGFLNIVITPSNYDSSRNCGDSYASLIRINSARESYDYGLSASSSFARSNKTYQYKEDVTFGSNIFSHYSAFGEEFYELYGSTSRLEISYQPSNCAWSGKDYSTSFNEILAGIVFNEDPNFQPNVETVDTKKQKILKVLQEYYDKGEYKGVESCTSYSSTNDEYETNLRMTTCLDFFKNKSTTATSTGSSKRASPLNIALSSIENGLVENKIPDPSYCDNVIKKYQGKFSDLEKPIISAACDNDVYQKVVSIQKKLPKQQYDVCGQSYTIQLIDKINNIDVVDRISKLSKIQSANSKLCVDFSANFRNKEVGVTTAKGTDQTALQFQELYNKDAILYRADVPNLNFTVMFDAGVILYIPANSQNQNDLVQLGSIR